MPKLWTACANQSRSAAIPKLLTSQHETQDVSLVGFNIVCLLQVRCLDTVVDVVGAEAHRSGLVESTGLADRCLGAVQELSWTLGEALGCIWVALGGPNMLVVSFLWSRLPALRTPRATWRMRASFSLFEGTPPEPAACSEEETRARRWK